MLKANEPQRLALYKLTSSLVRAYADIAVEMRDTGYSELPSKRQGRSRVIRRGTRVALALIPVGATRWWRKPERRLTATRCASRPYRLPNPAPTRPISARVIGPRMNE